MLSKNLTASREKYNLDWLLFHKKCPKNQFDLIESVQNFPFSLTQCCLKTEKTMLGSAHQK